MAQGDPLNMHSSAPPAGVVSLKEALARHNQDVNLMGVVVDFMPPSASKGPDWMCTFTIVDLSLDQFEPGVKVKYFMKDPAHLPKLRGTGDIIYLYRVQVRTWHGDVCVLSNFRSEWVVFPASTIPLEQPLSLVKFPFTASSKTRPPQAAYFQYAIVLCNSQDRSTYTTPVDPDLTTTPLYQPSAKFPPRQKFALIQDVQANSFYDLVGQVVKTFPAGQGRYELYITDYTKNANLFDYGKCPGEGADSVNRDGDQYGYVPQVSNHFKGWTGPSGRLSLQVTCFDRYADQAQRSAKEGENILLRNVRIKQNIGSRIEGTMFDRGNFQDRIDVVSLDSSDPRVRDMLKRKKEYEKRERYSLERQSVAGTKRKDGCDDKLARRRNLKKQKKLKQKTEAPNQQKSQAPAQAHNVDNQLHSLPTARPNPNVICGHPGIQTTSLSEILQSPYHTVITSNKTSYPLPFQNVQWRVRAKVIDFFPSRLEDFAVECRVSEYEDLSDVSSDAEPEFDLEPGSYGDKNCRSRWEWRFYLLIQDEHPLLGDNQPEKMKVLVAGQDAVMLLGMDPEDLRANPRALHQVHERLFILWGDLAERKAAPLASSNLQRVLQQISPNKAINGKDQKGGKAKPQERNDQDQNQNSLNANSRPFECCLKEYGVPVKSSRDGGSMGWKRMWQMFGTKIS